MLQIGILLIIFGFGSVLLETVNMEFRLLSWADDMQPAFGIVLGLVGIALVAGGIALSRRGAKQPVGQWSGNGHFAGSSPSAPQTTGPMTGGHARGQLQSDVEPTGLGSGPTSHWGTYAPGGPTGAMGSVPPGGQTGPGQVGGQYRTPEPAAPNPQHRGPQQRPSPPAADLRGSSTNGPGGSGQPQGGRPSADAPEPAAGPHKGESSQPYGGRQEAGLPGTPRPDRAQPRQPGASYGDAQDQARGSGADEAGR